MNRRLAGDAGWLAVRGMLAVACLLGAAGAARAEAPVRVRAAVAPPTAELGQRVTYRGSVVLPGGAGPVTIRWSNPGSSETLAWGALRPRYARGRTPARAGADRRRPAPATAGYDTAYVEVGLQIFDTGVVSIPGLEFQIQEGSEWKSYRLPLVKMPIVPVIAAGDSNATLRPLRGPLQAPWWERVPWTIVAVAAGALLAAFLVWRWFRRRRVVPAPVPVIALEDASTEALRELAALRRLQLPDAGRFADHAFALTRILRRFLERTRSTPRPGHTTPELVDDLRAAGLDEGEVARIARLLRYWDRVKFAREATGAADAREAETAVETLARSGAPAARGEAA